MPKRKPLTQDPPQNDPPQEDPPQEDPPQEDPPKEDPSDGYKKTILNLQSQLKKQSEQNEQLAQEYQKMRDGIASAFGEKQKTKEDTQAEFQQKMLESIEKINNRLDERESEAQFNKLSDNVGIKGEEQKDYFAFKLNRKMEQKGEDLTQKEIEDIGNEVLSHYDGVTQKETGPSSVSQKHGGIKRSNTMQVSQAQFSKMNVVERQDLYNKNPELHDKLLNEYESIMEANDPFNQDEGLELY